VQELQSQNNESIKRVGASVSQAPIISVVIPAYNTAEYIAQTLDSLFGQSFRDFEAIVVNDGSTDTEQLEKALETYLDDIIYIKQPNAGAGVARNTAIENARGEVLAFLDGDDLWFPHFLESQYAFLLANGYDMVYSNAKLFGMPAVEGTTFMDKAPSSGTADLDAFIDLRCNVITSGTVARKKTIINAGMFEKERVQAEDFHLWLRIAQTGAKIGYQREALLKYRVRLDSLSGDGISRIKRGIDVFERANRTIDLTDEQRRRVNLRVRELESDLAVAKGKTLLLNSKFSEAADAFSEANRYRKSPKLTAIFLLARVFPRALCKFYRLARPAEIEFGSKS
jgi:teichuronic acid biosynthesis glycosyltransferase TuaG